MSSQLPKFSESNTGQIYTNESIQQTEDNPQKDQDRKNTYALNINKHHPDLTNF